MIIELKVPDSIKLDPQTTVEFTAFLQYQVNRRCVGALRYGDRPRRKQKYLKRLQMELKKYRQTGNFENLLNIAVYTFLESVAPQNGRIIFDPTAASATRDKLGV